MKAITKIFLFVLVFLGASCSDSVKDTVSYMANVPVYMSREEFRAAAKVETNRPLKNPGKICLYGDYLFINEVNEGIHVIDNSDPSSPHNVAFIEIQGNIDLAAKDGILYADNLVDMLLFDISDPIMPKLKRRIEGVFAGILPVTDNELPISLNDTTGKVIVGWTQELITEEISHNRPYPIYYAYSDLLFNKTSSWGMESYQPGAQLTGVNGSMSRFAITERYLYTIHVQNAFYAAQPSYSSIWTGSSGWLKVFDIENDRCENVNSLGISIDVETLFAYNDHLFIGMANGMQIYSIQNPLMPALVSSSWHFWGCDPVVVDDDYAYLTIRSTNTCGQNSNLLQVIDISEISQPKVVSEYPLQEPFGLGIADNKLFICDNGLKVYDATIPTLVGSKLLFSTTEFKGFDLIPYHNLLLVIGGDGLYQYSYSSDNQLKHLSVIPVSNF